MNLRFWRKPDFKTFAHLAPDDARKAWEAAWHAHWRKRDIALAVGVLLVALTAFVTAQFK